MKGKLTKWVVILIGMGVAIAAVAWSTQQSGQGSQSRVPMGVTTGYHLPSFTLTNLATQQAVTVSGQSGKPMLINFWASWCPPCQEETPDLVAAYKQYGKKVEFIGVDLTVQDSLSNVKNFVQQYGVPYTVLLDQNGSTAQQFQVVGIPTSLFVDSAGQIIDRYTGAVPPQVLHMDLQKISG
ncbi:TlpA family protein disulfide reductase [Alicyclobacillaceae bacterium I2511]|nr:TlpA family protein disulfide reductase [Alicyclobacillaceae bacterium I2511]